LLAWPESAGELDADDAEASAEMLEATAIFSLAELRISLLAITALVSNFNLNLDAFASPYTLCIADCLLILLNEWELCWQWWEW
jgi:hypothetical protein